MIKKKEVIKMFDEIKNQEEIKIINKHQVVFYLERNVEPIRVELGYDDRIVFVYLKEDTIEVWKQWKAYTVQRKLEKWKETLNLYNVPSCDFELDDDDDYFFNE